jgi:hypothetical protein
MNTKRIESAGLTIASSKELGQNGASRPGIPALRRPESAIQNSPFTPDSQMNEEAYCLRRALTIPACAVCLRMQAKVARWGISGNLLRRALCGRWELLQSLKLLENGMNIDWAPLQRNSHQGKPDVGKE